MQEGQEEEHVGIGANELVRVRHLRGLGLARVHHHDAAAALAYFLETLARVRHLQEGPLRHDRVGADDQHVLHMVQVDEGLGEGKAVHLGGRGEAVGAVLGRGREHVVRAQALHEAFGEDRVQQAEARRGADVHRDRIGADRAQAFHLGADLGIGLRPADALVAVADALERILQAIGRVVHAVLVEPLHAGEAIGADVVAVRLELHHLAVFQLGHQAAGGLADAAERVSGLFHGRRISSLYPTLARRGVGGLVRSDDSTPGVEDPVP
ncbi:MAG TPA: hypothetical protein VLI06_19950 [Solimonas sp.]|nr:hypothetical protein [Solimonas sp.]